MLRIFIRAVALGVNLPEVTEEQKFNAETSLVLYP